MLSPSVKLIAGAFARDRAVDTGLGTLGISAALVSASFAGYMVVVGPEHGARGNRPPIAALPVPTHASPLTGGGAVPVPAAAPDSVDFMPTGTVATADAAPPRKIPDPNALLTDFAVRDVFDGTALVEARGSLQMVTLGEALPNAGEVLAIERQRGVWIVKTTGGVIRQRR